MASSKVRPYRIVASSFRSPIKLSTARRRGIRISAAKVCMSFNRLGAVFESVGHIAADMRDHLDGRKDMIHAMHQDLKESLHLTKDKKAEEEAEGGEQKQEITGGADDAIKKQDKKKGGIFEWLGKFLKPFEKFIAWIVRTTLVRGLLKWIADPANKDKLVSIIETLGKVGKFIMKWATFAISGILDGLAGIFGGIGKIKNGKLGGAWDLIKGVGSLLLGLVALKGLGYLLNPFSLINDIMNLMDMRQQEHRRNNQNQNQRSNTNRTRSRNRVGETTRDRNRRARQLRTQRRLQQHRTGSTRGVSRSLTANPRTSSIMRRGPTRALQRAGTKFLGRSAVKAIKGIFGRIPIVGSLVTVVASLLAGEPLGRALFRGLGAALGGLIGSFIPIPIVGTMLGEAVGIFTADLLYEGFMGKGWAAAGQKLKDTLMGIVTGAGKIGKAMVEWIFGGGLAKMLEGMGNAIGNFFSKGTERFVENFPKVEFPKSGIGDMVLSVLPDQVQGVVDWEIPDWWGIPEGLKGLSIKKLLEKLPSIPQLIGSVFKMVPGLKKLVDEDGEVKGMPQVWQLFNPLFMWPHLFKSFFGGDGKAETGDQSATGGNVPPEPKKNILGVPLADEFQDEEYLAHRDGSANVEMESDAELDSMLNAPAGEESVNDLSSENALNTATADVEESGSGPVPVMLPVSKAVTINSQGKVPTVIFKRKLAAYIE